jgi:hypothetical protein
MNDTVSWDVVAVWPEAVGHRPQQLLTDRMAAEAALDRAPAGDEWDEPDAGFRYRRVQPPATMHAAWVYPAGPWHQSE